ncbi:MAG: DUF5688 family protein [Lacrimispora sp.]|uniref:DUF5688 family protein n=1 Tax=Lacrimispora sp. TaxID=2719234 RepID=UPI0039E2B483
MVYETFLETVKNSLKETLGDEFDLSLQSVQKNNGLQLDGLCIGKAGEKSAPTVYLNQFYQEFSYGRPLEDILSDILSLYHDSLLPMSPPFEELLIPDQIKNKVIFRLISKTANETLLKDIPHIPYPDLDLTLVFCLALQRTKDCLMTALIHNSHLHTWGFSTEDLFLAAKANTPRLFPARIRSLSEVIKDIARETAEKELEGALEEFFDTSPMSPPMFVLTNSTGINGASSLFYEGILKDFANANDSDLIILPSSIHEVLIIPYNDTISLEELSDTVFSINQEEVPEEDRLSNHIYHYSKSKNSLTVAFTSSAPIGTENP